MLALAFGKYQYTVSPVIERFLFYQSLVDRTTQIALLVVTVIVPIHAAQQFLLQDILAFYGQRTGIFITEDKLSCFIGQIGNLLPHPSIHDTLWYGLPY